MGYASGNLYRACVVSRSFLQLFSRHFPRASCEKMFFLFTIIFQSLCWKEQHLFSSWFFFFVCHFFTFGNSHFSDKILRMIFRPYSMICWVVVHHLVPTKLIFKPWMVPLDEFVEDLPLRTMPTPISPCASPTPRISVSSFAVTILDVKAWKGSLRWSQGNDP